MVSNILYFQPYLGKISNLTSLFQMAWNHQLVYFFEWVEKKQPPRTRSSLQQPNEQRVPMTDVVGCLPQKLRMIRILICFRLNSTTNYRFPKNHTASGFEKVLNDFKVASRSNVFFLCTDPKKNVCFNHHKQPAFIAFWWSGFLRSYNRYCFSHIGSYDTHGHLKVVEMEGLEPGPPK